MSVLVGTLMNAKVAQMNVTNFVSILRAVIHARVVTGFNLTRSRVDNIE